MPVKTPKPPVYNAFEVKKLSIIYLNVRPSFVSPKVNFLIVLNCNHKVEELLLQLSLIPPWLLINKPIKPCYGLGSFAQMQNTIPWLCYTFLDNIDV